MTTLRERRQQELTVKEKKLIQQRDEACSKLVAIVTKLRAVQHQLRRYERLPIATPGVRAGYECLIQPEPAPVVTDDIPAFLRVKKLDPVAAQIASEQAETKKIKARNRIDTMKAKQRGDTKKMPLSGKDALAAING